MINPVIEYYQTVLEAMPYFAQVYGLCELKDNGKGIIQPVYYVGNKYQPVKINQSGVAYMRMPQDVSISRAESMRGCDPMHEFQITLRVIAMAKRATFPSDDAMSAHRLSATIIKGLSFENGPLRTQSQAAKLSSRASLYSTDTRRIISDEFSGLPTKDFNFDDVFCAVDIDLVMTSYNSCLIDPCDYIPRFCLQLESYVALP